LQAYLHYFNKLGVYRQLLYAEVMAAEISDANSDIFRLFLSVEKPASLVVLSVVFDIYGGRWRQQLRQLVQSQLPAGYCRLIIRIRQRSLKQFEHKQPDFDSRKCV